jgi:hypothetical protein
MATKVRRSTRMLNEFAKHGMNYLFKRDQVSPLEKERDREKSWLKEYIKENGTKDNKGNFNVYFERDGGPKFVPGPGNTEYWGLQQRRVPGGEYMDEDEVQKFVDTLPAQLAERVIYDVVKTVVDTEELYVLHQEGKITQKQLRALIRHHKDSYQLWPITEPPIDEDEPEDE